MCESKLQVERIPHMAKNFRTSEHFQFDINKHEARGLFVWACLKNADILTKKQTAFEAREKEGHAYTHMHL